jgi:hypothetical protein
MSGKSQPPLGENKVFEITPVMSSAEVGACTVATAT